MGEHLWMVPTFVAFGTSLLGLWGCHRRKQRIDAFVAEVNDWSGSPAETGEDEP